MQHLETYLERLQRLPENPSQEDADALFRDTVKLYLESINRVELHPGYCECRVCLLVFPVSDETWHGTLNGYGYHKCRCERCRKAARQYNEGRK